MVMRMLRRTYCNPYFVLNGGTGGGTPPVGSPPVISVHPSNASVTEPATATFTVTASNPVGMNVLLYQWQKNRVDIPGANSASYTTPATTASMDGTLYRCRVSNESGSSVTSNMATLSVASNVTPAPPAFTTHPTDLTLLTSDFGFMYVATTGSPAPTYQWEEFTTVWADMPGSTSYRLDFLRPTVGMNGRKYRCKATNNYAGGTTVTSNAATLYVNAPVNNLLWSPTPAVLNMYGANPTFTIVGATLVTKYATSYSTFPTVTPYGTYSNGWSGGAVASYWPTSVISPTNAYNDVISHEVYYTIDPNDEPVGGDGKMVVEFTATGGTGWNYTFATNPTARIVLSAISLTSGQSLAGSTEASTLLIEVLEGSTVKGSLTLSSDTLSAWKASLALGPAAGPWVFQVPNLTNPVGTNLKVRFTFTSMALKFGMQRGTHTFNSITVSDLHVVG